MLKDDELIGKFIKYSPEISEEIFDKITEGFEKYGGQCDYKGFKYNGFLKFDKINDRNIIQTMYNSNDYVEIFYKDIIGEDSLKLEDLVEGEIYSDNDVIFISKNKNNGNGIRISTGGLAKNNEFDISKKDIRIGNSEERQWLSVCIQENKFIPKEDVAKYMKPKFEVGKWYKNICNGEYIAKLTGIINGDKFPSIEYIYKNKYETTYSSVYFSMSSCKDAIECTLEEIQQYLPEGHVDKIKSFTVHNKCNIGDIIVSLEPKSIYVDTRKNGDLLKVLETSTNNSLYYKGYAYIVKENIDTYRLATPQEIEMYNKGIKNIYDVKEGEYKVGDWVKLVSIRPQHYNGAGEMDYLLGKVVQLKEPFKEVGINNINFDGVDGWAVSIRDIERKATPEEIYKAGGYPEQKEFVLPEKWCTKITKDNHKDIWEWTKWIFDYNNYHKYCTSRKTHSSEFPDTEPYTEITFEQFKKYVLKETISASEAKKDNMEEILLEAKRRFPIGCAYKGVMTYGPYIATGKLKSSITTNDIKIFDDGNCIYKNDQWAEIISSPEESDLITIAKERYPIGTKFYPAHVNTTEFCIVTNKNFTEGSNGDIVICTDEGRSFDNNNKYGNTNLNRVIYRKEENKWATIVSSPQEKEEKIPWDISWKCATDYWRIPTKEDEELLNQFKKPELVLKEEDEPVIFSNIKRERIVEIKIKLVD